MRKRGWSRRGWRRGRRWRWSLIAPPPPLLAQARRARATDKLQSFFESAGFTEVRVHARLDDRASMPTGEAVYLTARNPTP
jgi:hypothetical protein